jgi:hypothetical protein
MAAAGEVATEKKKGRRDVGREGATKKERESGREALSLSLSPTSPLHFI